MSVPRPALWHMASLSVGGGLPLGLVLTTIPVWLAGAGLSPSEVGLVGLASVPWSIKFLWAPLLDRFPLTRLGRRRSWMLVAQLGLFGAIAGIAALDPRATEAVFLATMAVALFSATQDVAMDGYAVELMRPEERGPGNALRTAFYRVGMLLASGVAVAAADQVAWSYVFAGLAAVVGISSLLVLTAPPAAQVAAPPVALTDAVIGPFLAFFRQRRSLAIALFIVLYKVGDNMALSMTSNFFVQALSVSNTEIGFAQKSVGVAANIAGTLAGGALLPRLGVRRALFLFGVAQAAMSLLYAATAVAAGWRPLMYAAIALEYLAAGMATAALITFMMRVVQPSYAATQLALLTSLMALGRSFAGVPSGFLAEALGYTTFFVLCAAVALPGLVLAIWVVEPDPPPLAGAS